MTGLRVRKVQRVSWTAMKINDWVLNKAGVKRELLDFVKAIRKLAYYGHTKYVHGVANVHAMRPNNKNY